VVALELGGQVTERGRAASDEHEVLAREAADGDARPMPEDAPVTSARGVFIPSSLRIPSRVAGAGLVGSGFCLEPDGVGHLGGIDVHGGPEVHLAMARGDP